MNQNVVTIYNFRELSRGSDGYGGISIESSSSVIHHHKDFYELILIASGDWEHLISNTTITLPCTTLLLLYPGSTHRLVTDSHTGRYFSICIEQHAFEKNVARIFPNFKLNTTTDYITKTIDLEKANYVEQLGQILYKSPKHVRSIADEIFFLLMSDFMFYNDELDCDTYVKEIVQKLNDYSYINTSVKDICANYPYSQSMLLRQFKKLTGMTIVEYKASQKMKQACQLLSETDTKIVDIASTLQYDSLSYFLRAFKVQVGMTPSEYRKKEKK